jgi:tetratricopeptide (TPR) repeat protein
MTQAMQRLAIGWLAALVATGPLAAATNTVVGKAKAQTAATSAPDDLVEMEYKRLLEQDDNAQAEVDRWIRDNNAAANRGAALPRADLRRRVLERLAPIRAAYADFIKQHPDHARARIAFGSFLDDLQDEDGARAQWEKALALDPKNPAVYNNLANLYGHTGPVKKAFEFYAKAIALNPKEPIYYDNLGTTIFVFRKDAMEFYGITEQQVYDKALALYSKALQLDPTNFRLASELAETYYGIKPLRLEDALRAWTNTLALAGDELEREGVYIHLSRLKLQADRFAEVRAHLAAVTNDVYAVLKQRISRNLEGAERKAKGTNSPPPALEKKE